MFLLHTYERKRKGVHTYTIWKSSAVSHTFFPLLLQDSCSFSSHEKYILLLKSLNILCSFKILDTEDIPYILVNT